nr:glycosyltransferase family 1 protein [uncultured Bacteroides sp.]
MRILLVFREGLDDNLFVYTLREGFRKKGFEVECSLDAFWNENSFYDIIHIQWPEELFYWNAPTDELLNKLDQRFKVLKRKGARIVYTRHNVCPHYLDINVQKSYELVQCYSDLIVHMGEYSKYEFINRYPESRVEHVIIPHHIYEGCYNEFLTKEESRLYLNIPQNRYVILAFGKFRHWDEIYMTIKAFLSCSVSNKYLLAPRMLPFSKNPKKNKFHKKIISLIGYYFFRYILKLINVDCDSSEVLISNENLAYYFSACDIVFIQRTKILNSGNVPLAFLFKRIAIAPALGNLKEILEKTGNPVFNPTQNCSIKKAIENAYSLSTTGLGEQNYIFAKENLSIRKICDCYVEAYKKISIL